jgi:hypothetical protein
MGIGAGALCLVMIVYGLLNPKKEDPQVTRAEYKAALQKWKDSGITSYDTRLTLTGQASNQDSEMILEVRDGRVTKALKNGRPEAKKDEDAWTIESQFRYIADDLAKAENPNNGFGVKQGVRITLHAEFNPKYGYPEHYLRRAHGPSPLHSQWRVQSFTPITPEK